MGKRCPEEFNPWPPFVDIFASVILVLMLFLLITVVNIGYYAQFKAKTAYTGSTEDPDAMASEESSKIKVDYCEKREEVVKIQKQDEMITFHKVMANKLEVDANRSLFSGGKSAGNAIAYAPNADQNNFDKQSAEERERQVLIKFENKEIFLNTSVKQNLRRFVKKYKTLKGVEFHISVNDPQSFVSKTLARQVSLGRALNIKKLITNMRIPKTSIKLKLQNENPISSKFGTVIIKAVTK